MINFIDESEIKNPLSTENGEMSDELKERMKSLTEREKLYFMTMWPKSGVLYITSKPGIAKSAIAREIARIMGFEYIDMRLAMNDESDFKYPYLKDETQDGLQYKVSDFAVPSWAFKANKKPTIIHFEELNRAPQFVRNAALQILLERQIGDFKFNSNVLMMASGNLGEQDGTDVEEFDNALNNRLIHFSHTLGLDEWHDNFGLKNVHSIILSFIKSYPERLYQDPTENTKAFATPRSWTFLSDFITKNFGKDAKLKDFFPYLQLVAHSYIGNTAQRFLQFCQDMINISIQDIINRYDDVKAELEKYNRDKTSELINSLKEIDIKTLSDKQLDNVVKFLKNVSDDELTSYLLSVLDNTPDVTSVKIKKFMQSFRDHLINLRKLNNQM